MSIETRAGMRARLRALIATVVVVGALIPSTADAATIWNGECRIRMTMTFGTSRVRLNSAPVQRIDILTEAADTSCSFTNGTTSGTGVAYGVNITGTGLPDLASTCQQLDGGGGYSSSFTGPTPRPPSNTGDWGYVGTVAGGVLTMAGTAANGADVVYAGDLRATTDEPNRNRINACLSTTPNTGPMRFTFEGELVINDPKLDE